MVKVENNNRYNVGDKVWWFDAWDTLRWGMIYEFKGDMAGIHEEGKAGIQTGAHLADCWPTKEECLDAANRRAELQKDEYRKEIKDVGGLVKFLFGHDTTSEFRDYEAVAVAKEKAAELLGLELED